MTLVDTIFSLSASLVMLSYLFKNILILRFLAITGGAGYILGSFLMPVGVPGKLSLLIFSCLNVTINLVHVFSLLFERSVFFKTNYKKFQEKKTSTDSANNGAMNIIKSAQEQGKHIKS